MLPENCEFAIRSTGIVQWRVICLICFFGFCFVFEAGSHYTAQAGLELVSLLSQPGSAGMTGVYHHS
jgi:hypothetical protein